MFVFNRDFGIGEKMCPANEGLSLVSREYSEVLFVFGNSALEERFVCP